MYASVNWVIIGSDNGLSVRGKAISWTSANICDHLDPWEYYFVKFKWKWKSSTQWIFSLNCRMQNGHQRDDNTSWYEYCPSSPYKVSILPCNKGNNVCAVPTNQLSAQPIVILMIHYNDMSDKSLKSLEIRLFAPQLHSYSKRVSDVLRQLLLTWNTLISNMYNLSHSQWSLGRNCISTPKLQRLYRWSLGMGK